MTRPMSDTNAKRPSTEIPAEILQLYLVPTAKTRIMYQTNLSYPATLKHLNHLRKLQLLELDHNGKKYGTTEKGVEYLKKYFELQKLLES